MLSRASLGFLALFALLITAAMWVYPGGTWQDPSAVGHRFFANYYCDLLRRPALNGKDNALGAALGTAGFACLGLALGPFWIQVSRLLGARARAFVRVAGVICAAATAVVALLPSDRFPSLHAPAVLTAGGLGLICGAACSVAAVRRRREIPAFAGASVLLLSAATLNLVLYVNVAYFDGADTIVLPASQKLATLGLIAWIVTGLSASASRPKP